MPSIVNSFPNLAAFPPFMVTSPPTIKYNCIAWAYGIDNTPMWPNKPRFYWPPNVPNTLHLNSFIALFNSIGYQACADGSYEVGITKIAIFSFQNGEPSHAARQLDNGFWTSKLGIYEDIMHTIEGLSGGDYGDAVQFMSKPI